MTEGTWNAMIEFMNLFFPPMIAIYIHCRRKREKLSFSMLPFLIEFVQKYFHFEIKVESNENEEK